MRVKEKSGALTVRAIAGTRVVLLAMSVEPARRKGLLGFTIERQQKGSDRKYVLPNFLLFKRNEADDSDHSSAANPFQAFQWCDYAAAPGTSYRYTVTARYGKPEALEDGDSVGLDVETEDPDRGRHGIYFNRGAAGWQAYQREFGKRDPDQVPDRAAYRWLSRGLEEALLAFIAKADGGEWGLRGAVYEFNYIPILDALWSADRRGVDVRVIVDDVDNATAREPTPHPRSENRAAVDLGEVDHLCEPRANTKGIPHNKFFVLLKDGKPIEVWTGSTNITKGGIFGHSNVGHVVRDEAVAAAYLSYWEELATDPARDPLQAWTVKANDKPERALEEGGASLPPDPSSSISLFSPREGLDALKWYAKLMDNAEESVFLTAAFGVTEELQEVFRNDKPYLRYLILDKEDRRIAVAAREIREDFDNLVAVGSFLGEGNWHQWLEERLTGFNGRVRFIHTKYMLIDPLGESPIVITGSANFSKASTQSNDENMLVISGDKAVADVYVTEFMRLFATYRLRHKAHAREGEATPNPSSAGPRPEEPIALADDDAWTEPYYEEGSPKEKERRLFCGLGDSD
ncbi:MAG TPA: phospholipase D-like domain-containing protein [Solirubrobacterales bacterium]|nr:phospholipase D-like domain-containing protein [Solirubrobacterales bacterium]